jgi:hypothetical protein
VVLTPPPASRHGKQPAAGLQQPVQRDGNERGIHIIEVPLDDPASAQYLHRVSAGHSCHDTGVILGDALLAACASGDGFTVFSMDPADGGSLETPVQLCSRSVTGVTIGQSAAFSYDGDVLIFGHEPGGGGQAGARRPAPRSTRRCSSSRPGLASGWGRWVLPRPQTSTENCTIHNLNVVPTDKGRVLVHGSYQSGIGVVDFTDPANAIEIAYADPKPLSETSLVLGGDWSTYWYNGPDLPVGHPARVHHLEPQRPGGGRRPTPDPQQPQTQESPFR